MLLLTAACAPKHHRVEPFQSDPIAAQGLEYRAERMCVAAGDGQRSLPAEPFVTDGCSVWLDRNWDEQCCVVHDIRYWCGGTAEERAAADRKLRQCVDRLAPRTLSWLVWLGVRIGGHPLFPSWYRWSYGRSYWPWYDPHEIEGWPETGDETAGAGP